MKAFALFARLAFAVGGAMSLTMQVDSDKPDRPQCIEEAQGPFAKHSNAAYVLGGIGKYGGFPGLNKCVALAETLIRIGGWSGKVYIMTDNDLNSTAKRKVSQISKNIKFVKIPHTRHGVDFRMHSAGGGGGYLKTMMFDLPEISEDVLVWHDCDKMIGVPNCIADLWRDVPLHFDSRNQLFVGDSPVSEKCANEGQRPGTQVDGVYCPENFHCFKGKSNWTSNVTRCGDGIHVGVFAAHRVFSKSLMHVWKNLQQSEPETYDRYTFWDAMKVTKARVTRMPERWRDSMYNKATGVQCVNHMSGPRVWDKKNRGFLEPFLQKMCLKSLSYKEAYFVYANALKYHFNKDGEATMFPDPRYKPLKHGAHPHDF